MFSFIPAYISKITSYLSPHTEEAPPPPTFHQRLKALGYPLDLIPAVFQDPVHFNIMNSPVSVLVQTPQRSVSDIADSSMSSEAPRSIASSSTDNSASVQTPQRVVSSSSTDVRTLSDWLKKQHEISLEELLQLEPIDREAFFSHHKLKGMFKERIHTIQPDINLIDRIESFIACLERIDALKKHLATLPPPDKLKLDGELAKITPDTLILMNPELELRHIPRLVAEQKEALQETVLGIPTRAKIELLFELNTFKLIVKEGILSSPDGTENEKFDEYRRIIEPHVELLAYLKAELGPLVNRALSTPEPSAPNANTHEEFSIPSAAFTSAEPAESNEDVYEGSSIPSDALIFDNDAANTSPVNRPRSRLLEEERELHENPCDFLRRYPPSSHPPASHVRIHGVFGIKLGSVLSESEPQIPKRVLGISPSSSPKRR